MNKDVFPNMQIRAVVGDYKIGKTLGEGSFSKVKLATHANGEKVFVTFA